MPHSPEIMMRNEVSAHFMALELMLGTKEELHTPGRIPSRKKQEKLESPRSSVHRGEPARLHLWGFESGREGFPKAKILCSVSPPSLLDVLNEVTQGWCPQVQVKYSV